MRILHILDHGLPLHSGYTFRTRALLKAQIARGWEVAAVTGPRHGDYAAADEIVDGLQFHRTPPVNSALPIIGEWREIGRFARRIRKVAMAFKPDILHAHSPVLDAMAGQRAARRLKLPFVYEIRAFWEDAAVGNGTGREGSWKYNITRALETRAVRRADAVAVICDGLRADLGRRGIDPGKIFVSPNGVDLNVFGDPLPYDQALAEELGVSGGETIGFIGSFYDYEGLDVLIDAMPELVRSRPSMHLILVGGGPAEAALRAQAAASPAAGRIKFIGRVPHHDVDRYYSLVDVLVYPRKRMRLTELVTPLKPLEAMAQRKLVAASDVGGHRELIRDGDTGTLFKPDDALALARSVAAIFSDRDHWDARRARARAFVEAERNWSINVSRYESVYQKLAMSGSSKSAWSHRTVKA
ncbi:TIGR04063 family PEP-CTERM/XrtA system glycosyltransferase [Sphingomonas sp.]|jgi:PEP-CTERM/exosortase A-associated glycosyltransferase|uniref:TIGR04063 family PEP-CTERM/XrtA system glycosyltransferase n=1 Tax=Sphingomonas sp. TaxID=28214 RepID=UPI002ED81C40